MSNKLDEFYKIYENQGTAQRDADIAASNRIYDTQKADTRNTYNTQIAKAEESYEDLYRENAVQKLINEREVAESMANLGLTDSGLSRTQQTAVQLSYANRKGEIDNSKREAVNSLTADLAAKINEIETNRLAAEDNIASTYHKNWQSAAQSSYNTYVEEETNRIKAAQAAQAAAETTAREASYIIRTNGGTLRRDFTGSLKDNGVSVIYDKENGKTTYIDNNSGKKTTLSSKINPYTGTTNADTAYGVFSNGYQPNNVGGSKLKKQGDTVEISGNRQNIWTTGTRNYIWDGSANVYREVYLRNGYWVIK